MELTKELYKNAKKFKEIFSDIEKNEDFAIVLDTIKENRAELEPILKYSYHLIKDGFMVRYRKAADVMTKSFSDYAEAIKFANSFMQNNWHWGEVINDYELYIVDNNSDYMFVTLEGMAHRIVICCNKVIADYEEKMKKESEDNRLFYVVEGKIFNDLEEAYNATGDYEDIVTCKGEKAAQVMAERQKKMIEDGCYGDW